MALIELFIKMIDLVLLDSQARKCTAAVNEGEDAGIAPARQPFAVQRYAVARDVGFKVFLGAETAGRIHAIGGGAFVHE